MASSETMSSDSARDEGFFRGALSTWRRARQRVRTRQLSFVRFQLTREGLHFIGILLFIFIGAAIREISLLILLAGAMIGLVVLQWRFNTSTLARLQVRRRLPRSTAVGRQTEVEVSLLNPKYWLGAWLILIRDRIERLQPVRQRIGEGGLTLVDSVRPKSVAESRYQLEFLERGEYQIGPTTISTRFPLGLGQGWRTVENISQIIVHPKQGELTSKIKDLFHLDQMGHAKSSSQAGTQEGEFFGLRPWATGDSRRWIHWRTTARLGQLSVRQFEQQQQRQVCVLLDLGTPDALDEESFEKAISFLATLTAQTLKQGRDKLSVAVAGEKAQVFPAISSPTIANSLYDHLALATPASIPDLGQAIRGLNAPLLRNPNLIVISTRPEQPLGSLISKEQMDLVTERLVASTRLRWLNATSGDLEEYFQWT